MTNKLRFKNLIFEAAHAIDRGQDSRALLILDQARLMLINPVVPRVAPEDDPNRSAEDRAAWSAAKAG
jgi:hypothetical protein